LAVVRVENRLVAQVPLGGVLIGDFHSVYVFRRRLVVEDQGAAELVGSSARRSRPIQRQTGYSARG
jgi:hypothetical protein